MLVLITFDLSVYESGGVDKNPKAAALERLEEQEHWGKNKKKSSEWGRKGTN